MDADQAKGPGWRTVLGLLFGYAGAAALATYPHVTRIASELPGGGDPPQHLWILRWYRTCLLEGRAPWICPELQYPIGAPLGNFSPLHVQAALYLPLSFALGNDVLCYNLIWLLGLATTGLGTFALAWTVVRDRACAALAGLLAMLGGAMLFHAQGHLELIYLGGVPLFLAAWLRLLDAPGRGRLLGAVGAYLLMSACAAYYAVLAIVPAALAVIAGMTGAGRRGAVGWLRGRVGWLAGFGALALPGLLLLFAPQVWNVAHGEPMVRSRLEFADFAAPAWSYVVPTPVHALGRRLPTGLYAGAGYFGARSNYIFEEASYLGLVTLGLLALAAIRRAGFPRAGFWWATLAALVVLSLGAYGQIGGRRVALPSLWLWRNLPPFRLIRSPARYNLPATVVAAVIAAAGLRALTDGWRPSRRLGLVAGLACLALVDLALPPLAPRPLTPVPAAYEVARRLDPDGALLEVPTQNSGGDRTGLDRTYWQALHRRRTSAGYSGVVNVAYNQQIFLGNPFPTWQPDFLAGPSTSRFGPVEGAAFRDYAWLFLHAHGYRFVLLHKGLGPDLEDRGAMARLRAELRGAEVFEDDATALFDRERLAPPAGPVVLPTAGWRPRLGVPGPAITGVRRVGSLVAYVPPPARPVRLRLRASAPGCARVVRLVEGEDELARWRVEPGDAAEYPSPALRLGPGLHALELVSDGETRPSASRDALDEARTPYSLRVDALGLEPAPESLARGSSASDGR